MLSLWTASKLPCSHCVLSLPLPRASGSGWTVYHHWMNSHGMPGLVWEASWSFRSSFRFFVFFFDVLHTSRPRTLCIMVEEGELTWTGVEWWKHQEKVAKLQRTWVITWLAKRDLGALGDGPEKIPWQKLEGCSCVIGMKYQGQWLGLGQLNHYVISSESIIKQHIRTLS